MSNSIKYLIKQFNLQTKLFNNATANVADADSQKQMNANTNHIAWLTGHTVSSRYLLANVLGLQLAEPFPALFANLKGLEKGAKYPAMKDLTKDWNTVSEKIEKALNSLTEEALNSKMPRPVPTGDALADFIAFLMHHEAYTLGQIGISRRFHGLEAMKYN